MTNFEPQEFTAIWARLEQFITSNINVGRGCKSAQKPKDVLFMKLAALKYGGNWDFLAIMFGVSASSFERLVMKFVHLISEAVYDSYVEYQARKWSMEPLKSKYRCFRKYPMARFSTDVTFQPIFRPSGSIEEGKKYVSGKHKLYGYKVEDSVLPCGMALGGSLHEPGAVFDLVIFQQM